MNTSYYIGWDVGAWRTTKKDAVWILDDVSRDSGPIPRTVAHKNGTLSDTLLDSCSITDFVDRAFEWCGAEKPGETSRVTLAIDAPFAFPAGLVNLLRGESSPGRWSRSIDNPYLFRQTERTAAEHLGRNPLSAVQDQIGSQTTKIIHFLTMLMLEQVGPGVWRPEGENADRFTVIETYPAMSKLSKDVIRPGIVGEAYTGLLSEAAPRSEEPPVSDDEKDALLCALVARLHATRPEMLHQPPEGLDASEGWIWFPRK